jgi:hypothetical protein
LQTVEHAKAADNSPILAGELSGISAIRLARLEAPRSVPILVSNG